MMSYRLFFSSAVLAAVLVAGGGCKSSTEPAGSQISMSAKYVSPQAAPQPGSALSIQSSLGIDSVAVTRAKIVMKSIKFEQENGEESEFRTAPFVFEPNLSGIMQELAVFGVPSGSYDEVKFKIHRVDSAEVGALAPADRAQFTDFLPGGGHSIIIDGTVYRSGMSPQAFHFASQIDAEQESHLAPPLVVSDAHPVANVTLVVNASKWFRNPSGALLDPTDPANANLISESLRASITVFRDEDRDGEEDDGGDDHGD